MTQKKLQIEEETVQSGDRWIWGIYIALCLVSIVESYAALSQVVGKQGLYYPLVKHCLLLGSGFLILWGLQRLHYTKYIPFIKVFSALTFLSVIAVLFIGQNINGAMRAIPVPGLGTIQPAELSKLAIATLVPLIVSRHQVENGVSRRGAILAVSVVCAFALFLLGQGLTNTILLMFTSVIIMWIGGIKVHQLFMVFGVYVAIAGCVMLINKNNEEKEAEVKAHSYEITQNANAAEANAIDMAAYDDGQEKSKRAAARRSDTWSARLTRWKVNHDSLVYMPLTPENMQETFAHMAQAHGGVYGVGPGNSRECSRLPLAFSDYIFSIVVEEEGLIGGIVLIVLYLWLLIRAGLIASRCARALPALLIMGMAVMITFQALVHMAINTGLFPVSGQSLPLISEGGTSVWVISAAFGIMLSVSRHASQNTLDKMKKKEEQDLPKEEQAPNPMQIILDNEK